MDFQNEPFLQILNVMPKKINANAKDAVNASYPETQKPGSQLTLNLKDSNEREKDSDVSTNG